MDIRRTPGSTLIPTLAILLAACTAGTDVDADTDPPQMSAEELTNVPEVLTLDDRTLELETYLWRDFMPISPPDGKPLIARLTVRDTADRALPDDLEVEVVWIVNDGQVWSSALTEQPTPEDPSRREFVARDGPKWGPGVQVDVVIGLATDPGPLRLLRAPNQEIERTS